MKVLIKINRIIEGNNETLGHGTLYLDNEALLDFVTLELPNKHNKSFVSSIPSNLYNAEIITRQSNGKRAIHIKDVPNRTAILIHPGNYNSDIQGCILAGKRFSDIDSDGVVDVIETTETCNKILSLIPSNADIQVLIQKIKA